MSKDNDGLDEALGPLTDQVIDRIQRLRVKLAEVELIGEDNPGKVLMPEIVDQALAGFYGIEVEDPEPRLYGLNDPDIIVGTRLRKDGQYEHSVRRERPANRVAGGPQAVPQLSRPSGATDLVMEVARRPRSSNT